MRHSDKGYVEELSKMLPNREWTPLGTVASRTHVVGVFYHGRVAEILAGDYHVMSSHIILRNLPLHSPLLLALDALNTSAVYPTGCDTPKQYARRCLLSRLPTSHLGELSPLAVSDLCSPRVRTTSSSLLSVDMVRTPLVSRGCSLLLSLRYFPVRGPTGLVVNPAESLQTQAS